MQTPGTRSRIHFAHVAADAGLSQNVAQKILQDRYGFIWIGTQSGLNRFDGYRFEVFEYQPDHPQGLTNGWVNDLLEDSNGQLWIATDDGLDRFEPATQSFTHYRHDPADATSLRHNTVRALAQTRDGTLWVGSQGGLSRLGADGHFSHPLQYQPKLGMAEAPGVTTLTSDEQGRLWIGTRTDGVLMLDPDSGAISRVELQQDKATAALPPVINSVLLDRDGSLWVGTLGQGLIQKTAQGEIHAYRHTAGDASSISSDTISKVFQDRQGLIWAGTNRGLSLWPPSARRFERFQNDPDQADSLRDDVVMDIFQDAGGVIWVGTFNGVNRWNPEVTGFAHIKRQEETSTSLPHNKISAFAEGVDNTLWVATLGGGLSHWNMRTNHFKNYQARGDGLGPAEDMVGPLLYDDSGRLWAGTMSAGLSVMEPDSDRFTHFRYSPQQASSLSANAIAALLQDEDGRIWIATYGGGLNEYLGEGRFQRFPQPTESQSQLPANYLVDIEQDGAGGLWLASDGGGVLHFDPDTGTFATLQVDEDGGDLSLDRVICLLQTEQALWIGTRDNGLIRYQDQQWRHFGSEQGLPSNAIYGLLEDTEGNIWISHTRGLTRLRPTTESFTTFDVSHGLQSRDFNDGAYLKLSDGRMVFGGANGFNLFSPQDVTINTHVPPVRLTRFTKFNREVALTQPAHMLDRVTLDYDDYVVGFEFAALDYTDPSRNQYRYMLAGFDREWVYSDGIRQATYTNLSAGNYNFLVQGSNNDGLWNENGLSIAVSVESAPWASWWAMALYTIAAIGLIYAGAQAYSIRLHRDEQNRYSKQLEMLVAERTQELETEITGHKAVEQELSRSLQEKEVLLKEVHHRVKNNMQVVSSLLNIQADTVMDERFKTLLVESQQRIKSMALIHENLYRSDNLLEINFREYIEMLAQGLVRFYRFEALIIDLQLKVDEIFLDIDTAVPCGLIINELISNALKHAFVGRTGEGIICVSFGKNGDHAGYEIQVSDDGHGVSTEVDLASVASMGMEIVRILTEQLEGDWDYRSDSGAVFTIRFPGKRL
ncbi:MAG: two-component regulator propeller domain-containing protein [Pseudomonadota bacterium]